MERDAALVEIIAAAELAGAAVFVGNGDIARAAHALADYPLTFPMLGSMGLAAPLAAGFAHRSGRPVVVVEGDGNALMGLSGLPATGAAATPFVHLVLDNGVYETTGGQPSLSRGTDLLGIALAAGYARALTVDETPRLRTALAGSLRRAGRTYLLVPTARYAGPRHPRVPHHPREISVRFRSAAAGRPSTSGGSRQ